MSKIIHFTEEPAMRSLVAPTLFAVLDADLRTGLLANAPLLRFSDTQIIQHKGDEPDGFWVIKSGAVKIGQFRLNGEFRVIAILSAGDSYGELAMFANSSRAVDSVAEGEVTLNWIGRAAFEQAIMDDSAAMRSLIGALAAQLQEMINLVAGLGNGTSSARVSAVLANLAGGAPGQITIRLGQQDLAELTGLTRATVNKCLSDLESRGALTRHYGKIVINDQQALRNLALG